MKFKNLFTLNLKTLIIDLIIFIIGIFLAFGFLTLCTVPLGEQCPQPPFFYLGLILMLISIIHFITSLIIFVISKFKSKKK